MEAPEYLSHQTETIDTTQDPVKDSAQKPPRLRFDDRNSEPRTKYRWVVIVYFMLQAMICTTVISSAVRQQVLGVFEALIFVTTSVLAVTFYCLTAFKNPGYLIGNIKDIEMKAGAYNPKHYAIGTESNQDSPASNAQDLNQISDTGNKLPKNEQGRKTNFLARGFQLSRDERSKTNSSGTTLPTSQGFIATNQQSTQNIQKSSDPSSFELMETQANQLMAQTDLNQQTLSINEQYASQKSSASAYNSNNHRRIKSVMQTAGTTEADAEMPDEEQDQKRKDAFAMIQKKIAEATKSPEYEHQAAGDAEDAHQDVEDADQAYFTLQSYNGPTVVEEHAENHVTDTSHQPIKDSLDPPERITGLNLKGFEESQPAESQAKDKMETIDEENITYDLDQNEAGDDSTGSDEDIVLFIEYKYCTVCHIEMPIRCKHCKDCDQCVATHDHHCPWVNNCIGELNARQFYLFLWAQASQLIFGLIIASKVTVLQRGAGTDASMVIVPDSQLDILPRAIAFCLMIVGMLGMLAFVIALLVFHTMLIGKNLTSWEYLAWMKITYLKVWPRKLGSPFSKGSWAANFKQYFQGRPSNDQCFQLEWTMPQKLPKLQN